MNNLNRIPTSPSFTNNYSGAKINNGPTKNINSNISSNHSNNYYGNNNIKNNDRRHEYKGMDGKIYYDEKLLDFANKQFLENQMKRNNAIK